MGEMMKKLKKLLCARKGAMGSNYMLVSAAAIIGIVGGSHAVQKTAGAFLQDTAAELETARYEVPASFYAPYIQLLGNGSFKSSTNGTPKKMEKLRETEGPLAVYCEKMGNKSFNRGETIYSEGWLSRAVSQDPMI